MRVLKVHVNYPYGSVNEGKSCRAFMISSTVIRVVAVIKKQAPRTTDYNWMGIFVKGPDRHFNFSIYFKYIYNLK